MSQPSPALSIQNREDIYKALHLRILGLARKLGCREHSSDIAQETMLELARRYAEINSLEELVKLANRICVNKVLNLRRQNRHEAASLDDHATHAPTPEDLLSNKELQDKLRSALQRCSPRCKTLFGLLLAGEETTALLKQLGCSQSALYSLRSRCLQELRSILEPDQ
jgi:RNA polymerase sigma factor (sigma-70 family)